MRITRGDLYVRHKTTGRETDGEGCRGVSRGHSTAKKKTQEGPNIELRDRNGGCA
jgi:hypothetical protein